MKKETINNLVKKMEKKLHTLISIDDIKQYTESFMGDDYTDQKMYKILYTLKNRGHLIGVKKDTFFIKKIDEQFDEYQILERFYWTMLKQHSKKYILGDRYIGGIKALEIHMNNYSIPDEITVITKNKQSTEIIMFDKKIIHKKYTDKNNNLFPLFHKCTQTISVHGSNYTIANKELALLESLYNPPASQKHYIDELIKKLLKTHKKHIDIKYRTNILKANKHHSSINRLYTLSHHVDPVLAESIKTLIKKYSYFF